MQSLESGALEATKTKLRGLRTGKRILRIMPIYLLVTLTVFLLGLVSVLVTKALPTLPHLRSIISDKAFIALLSLG